MYFVFSSVMKINNYDDDDDDDDDDEMRGTDVCGR